MVEGELFRSVGIKVVVPWWEGSLKSSKRGGSTELSREIVNSNSKITTNCEYNSFHGNCRLLFFFVNTIKLPFYTSSVTFVNCSNTSFNYWKIDLHNCVPELPRIEASAAQQRREKIFWHAVLNTFKLLYFTDCISEVLPLLGIKVDFALIIRHRSTKNHHYYSTTDKCHNSRESYNYRVSKYVER